MAPEEWNRTVARNACLDLGASLPGHQQCVSDSFRYARLYTQQSRAAETAPASPIIDQQLQKLEYIHQQMDIELTQQGQGYEVLWSNQ